jgi:glyoxylase-like metal-dependent hydrolase (beta-lactamase superfamily II)
MKLGKLTLSTVSGGRFQLDGGSMFGVVPKPLWSRVYEPDEKNRIQHGTNCVLVQDGSRNLLIDTGYGSKLSPKEREVFASEEGSPLLASLAACGLSVEQIETVILSHLHFDHAGGATRFDESGKLVPTFPRATYIAQRVEWETATAELPELRGSYPLENLLPLRETGQLKLVDGNVVLTPGIRAIVTGGHTAGHMSVVIESDDQTAVFLADLCPTWRHLRTLWCMAYDVDLLQTRRMKPKLLGEIADNGWLALSDHDDQHAAARIARDSRQDFVVTESIPVL